MAALYLRGNQRIAIFTICGLNLLYMETMSIEIGNIKKLQCRVRLVHRIVGSLCTFYMFAIAYQSREPLDQKHAMYS